MKNRSITLRILGRLLMTAALLLTFSSASYSASLVSDETIAEQKKLTTSLKLKNGIDFTYRQVPGSDIINLYVSLGSGLKDISPGKKSLNKWLWGTMPMAAEGYPKEKLFKILEKFSIQVGCTGGIEWSNCSLGTLNEYWDDALPVFAAILQKPSLNEKDAKLIKDRLISELKNEPADPGSFVNDVINRKFYGKGHPYRLTNAEALEEVNKLTLKELKDFHSKFINSSLIRIVAVGSIPAKKIYSDLNRYFGKIPAGKANLVEVKHPDFDKKNAFILEDRDIPTAYIRAKMVAPSATDKDEMATRLMYEILDKELHEEVRTKNSLSYSVFAYYIPYSMGIGVIGASTSKPKEALAAINKTIQKMKTTTYTVSDLDEYKNIFITEYFLTQESHANLASSIGRSVHYFGSPDYLYNLPKRLEAITPKDIKAIANKVLKKMTMGVIYSKKKFEEKWARDFIEANKG